MAHRSDKIIQTTVSDELHFIPNIDSNLTVTVRDGVVVLEGDVASVSERIAATKAAERVWGVKAVTDRTVVRSAGTSGADDAELARSATSMLNWSADIPANAVTVQVSDRKLTLTGKVTWDYQRAAAAHAVSHMRGITGVHNKITLDENATVPIVKDGVEEAIRRNTPLDASTIAVEVHGRKLKLSGNVRSCTERRQAEHLAWAAPGVTTVENDLIVTS